MRRSTPRAALYAWHAAALRGEDPDVFAEEPQCGWFLTRLVRDGPQVPVRIWCEQVLDPDTGELAEDERLVAQIGDERETDAGRVWLRVARHPIPEDNYFARLRRLTSGPMHERATRAPVDLITNTARP